MNKFDTDKYTHGYIPIYEPFFNEKKDSKNILEIGIFKGESLKHLSNFFNEATIYGWDINDCKMYETEKIKTLICDQESRESMSSVLISLGIEFDIIIDDGGHTMKQQQTSFGYLFPKLKKGGIYIIEDLHTSNWKSYVNQDCKITTLKMLEEYKKNGVIESNYILDDEKKYINENIKSITIWSKTPDYNKSVTSIIIKK